MAQTGIAVLSLGHPDKIRERRTLCSRSVLDAVLISSKTASRKTEGSGFSVSNSKR